MQARDTQRVYRLYDFTKAQLIPPAQAYWDAGNVGSAGRLNLVIESARPDAKHIRDSSAPAHADGAGGSLMLVAVAEGAILAAHLSSSVRLAFLSGCMFPERSSPSRVRFAAPNNGAPLTAPGRSARPSRQERKALWRTGCRWRHYPNAKMAPFLTATVTLRV